MKHLIALLFISLFCLKVTAQTEESPYRTYFDAKWKECEKSDAAYYRDFYKKDKRWVVKDYFITRQIQMTGFYSDKALTVKDGLFVYYYKTGQKRSTGLYHKGKENGEWSYWYEDGTMDGNGAYYKGKYTGLWKWFFENGQQSSAEEYKNGEIVSLRFWDEDGTENRTTKVIEQMPQFPGGSDKLMEYVSTEVKYPQAAKLNNIQGRVIVQFVVGVDGEISDVDVVKSVDSLLDNEATRVVRAMPTWSPGLQHNRPVPVRFTLPVYFKLQ